MGLISLTSIVAYFGVQVEPSLYSAWDSRLIFIVCLINIISILLWSFFVMFSMCLIIIASLISVIFALAILPFMLIYLLSYNTCKEIIKQVFKTYNINRMRAIYRGISLEDKQENVKEEKVDSISCAIWFLEFKEDVDYILNFDWKHIFHQICVEKWLNMNKNSCPLCRNRIFKIKF